MNNFEERKNVTINADVFIIPNSPALIDEFCNKKELQESIKSICNASNIEFNENVKLVQCWFVNNDSDNIGCHGLIINIDNEEYAILHGAVETNIPATFFKNKKEGDVIEITMPISVYGENEEMKNINLCINARLNQLDYRYKRFGSFECVLKNIGAFN